MTKKVCYQRVTAPTLFITKGRQRVKQYDNVVYLKNGDEFELELWSLWDNGIFWDDKWEYFVDSIIVDLKDSKN